MKKRSAILVAAGLVVSLATGFVAFLNGGLGPAADASTRPSPAAQRQGRVEASAQSGPAAGTAFADRRAAGSGRDGGSSNDD